MSEQNQNLDETSPPFTPDNSFSEKKKHFSIRIIQSITGPWNRRNLIEWIVVIGSIFIIKGCLVDQYLIPSSSMEPTLHGGNLFTGDRVLVNKTIYGIRIPFTTFRLYTWDKPKRWDIVVFKSVEKGSEHSTLIKRVVGLPGEHVRIKNGKIEINGKIIPFPPFLPSRLYYFNDEDLLYQYEVNPDPRVKKFIEELWKKYPYRYGCIDQKTFTTIPEGYYFLLGDNSLNSVDGRVFGWVPENRILGRAFAIWWPPHRWRDLTGFSYTLWGQTFLYGIPTLIILTILVYVFIRRKQPQNLQ